MDRCIDDRGLAAAAHAGQFGIVAQVDMSVHEPLGPILLQQVVEADEALVGPVNAVVEVGRRGMGQQQIDAARPVSLEPEPPHPAAHLPFRVLEGLRRSYSGCSRPAP